MDYRSAKSEETKARQLPEAWTFIQKYGIPQMLRAEKQARKALE